MDKIPNCASFCEENQQVGRVEEHPLLNDLIITKLFEKLDMRDLFKARLVCTSWHDTSLSQIRNGVTIRSNFKAHKDRPDDDGFIKATRSKSTDHNPNILVELNPEVVKWSNLESTPYRNFHLTKWRFMGHSLEAQPLWRQCGHWIHNLTLDRCSFHLRRKPDAFLSLLEKVPNLRELQLVDVTFTAASSTGEKSLRRSNLALLIPRNITCLSVLQRLRISARRRGYYELLELLQDIAKVRSSNKDGASLQLKHLEIKNSSWDNINFQGVPASVANLLMELRLPLETLTLSFGADSGYSTFEALLRSLSPTLKSLQVRGHPPWPNFPYSSAAPVNFNFLQELKLPGCLIQSVGFLRQVPNLKVFECLPLTAVEWAINREFVPGTDRFVNYDHEEARIDIQRVITASADELTGFQLPHLATFRFPLFRPTDPDAVMALAGCMPSLKNMSISALPTTFPAMCSSSGWKNALQELCVTFGEYCDDFVLTGISSEEPLNMKHPPNIADLIYLQKLEIMPQCMALHLMRGGGGECNCVVWKVTGAAFQNGFRMLENLSHLEVYTSNKDLDKATKANLVAQILKK